MLQLLAMAQFIQIDASNCDAIKSYYRSFRGTIQTNTPQGFVWKLIDLGNIRTDVTTFEGKEYWQFIFYKENSVAKSDILLVDEASLKFEEFIKKMGLIP